MSEAGSKRRLGPAVHVVLANVQVAFASLAVEGKIAMNRYGVSPAALAMTRIAGGAAVFMTLHLASGSPRLRSIRDAAELALLAVFGIVLNQALFLAGLSRTQPMSATLLVATIPVFVASIAAATGREPLTRRTAAGIAVAFSGVFVLTGFAFPARGDLLVLLNALSYATYVVFAKGALERLGTATVVAWVFTFGAVLFAPFGGAALLREAPAWPAPALLLVGFIVLVPTVVAYSGSAWALERAPSTLVAVYVYLQPLVTATLAWIQLGTPPEARSGVAAGLILLGVTIVATAPRQARRGAEVRSTR
ncbi:MAG TPA: DMT family transporter [Minicystis sp.]|nr:DMT family transporter [Minicystis sp.]